ncbi:MAG TPA: hypothetical protein VD788_10270, partial [Candidatus Polarisedimenticolaceae bacterium]|nr:hypothetical protein [Candidatus Polarisedimenticolaceae bacterium]
DYALAESEMCRALYAASGFGPRDWRFAETLDELGLIAFRLRDYEVAERLQGAAIAEMLLAVGPHGEPLADDDGSKRVAIRPDCRSGIEVYTRRLGWIHEHVEPSVTISEIRDAPWVVLTAGYIPLDAASVHRLDWLVSQYLLVENVAAAELLTEFQRRIRGE